MDMHIITSVCLCVLHVCMCVCVISCTQSVRGRVEAPRSRREATRMVTVSLSLSLCIIACTQSDRWREGRDPSQQTKGLNPKPRNPGPFQHGWQPTSCAQVRTIIWIRIIRSRTIYMVHIYCRWHRQIRMDEYACIHTSCWFTYYTEREGELEIS